ncbi:TPA: DUF3265 domain-containing protein [Vibrio parahaemolyticus]|nr:DUF3265 domain-containing protein [Vibrio parahaemolyticus]HCM1486574.1 DUF3265 domain-containing protein [Vibrio parahaemolyticus]
MSNFRQSITSCFISGLYFSSVRALYITICLRGIRNAWHFHYALVLVFKVACGDFGIALLTP